MSKKYVINLVTCFMSVANLVMLMQLMTAYTNMSVLVSQLSDLSANRLNESALVAKVVAAATSAMRDVAKEEQQQPPPPPWQPTQQQQQQDQQPVDNNENESSFEDLDDVRNWINSHEPLNLEKLKSEVALASLNYTRKLNEHKFRYIINASHICSDDDDDDSELLLVAFILSAVDNFERRAAIRSTWANTSAFAPRMRYVFLVGRSPDSAINEQIGAEAARHGDLAQQDFTDAYKNLTHKTMMGFGWVAQYCARALYALKTDDDIVVNVRSLLDYLDARNYPANSMLGLVTHEPPVIRLNRSKYYMSDADYKYARYPNYCDGMAYVVTSQLAARLYERAEYVAYLFLEDVFVGLLALTLDAYMYDLGDYYIYEKDLSFCYARVQPIDTFFFANTLLVEDIYYNWQMIANRYVDDSRYQLVGWW